MLLDNFTMAKRKNTDQVQINVRMREALRSKLEQSAKTNDGSLNREIVDRLERSFDRQELLVEALTLAYGEKLAGLLMMVGRAMNEAGRLSGYALDLRASTDAWVDYPFPYQQASNAAVAVLSAFRPEGDPTPPQLPSHFPKVDPEKIGTKFASHIVDDVKRLPDFKAWSSTVRRLVQPKERK
jgi:hypothetical protein